MAEKKYHPKALHWMCEIGQFWTTQKFSIGGIFLQSTCQQKNIESDLR